jgi:hypothetical protein
VIQPDTATTDSDTERIDFEWSWDLNILFPKYYTKAFENTILHLHNLAAISIDNINKKVEDFKDLDNFKISETNITSTKNVLIILQTLITINLATVCSKSVLCRPTSSNHCFQHTNPGSGQRGLANANREDYLKNWHL